MDAVATTFHATLDDWRRVAAQVHWETITEPVRPILMLRLHARV